MLPSDLNVHLREYQGLVPVRVELGQHLVKNLEKLNVKIKHSKSYPIHSYLQLAAYIYHVLATVVEGAALGDGVLNEVGVVDGLPHVHHPALDAVVPLVAPGPVHLPGVGRAGSWFQARRVLVDLGDVLLKLVITLQRLTGREGVCCE